MLRQYVDFSSRLVSALLVAARPGRYQGFVHGHTYLVDNDWESVEELLENPDESLVREYEEAFAALVGTGHCSSFAAARMAFFTLLEHLGIGEGDEVLLTGFTCSVMADAIRKCGATIVYVDVNPDTLGTSAPSVEQLVTGRTKMVVAQHSFGLPCDIERIAVIAKDKGVFLLEDCAIALGSSVNSIVLGNFGDAALFSTDHTKPLNTFTGGLLYSHDNELIEAIRIRQQACESLPRGKSRAILTRVRYESALCNAGRYHHYPLSEVAGTIRRLFGNTERPTPYLDEDQGNGKARSYPYPARMPSFLAYIGLQEVRRWPALEADRKDHLAVFLRLAKQHGVSEYLPQAYYHPENRVVPLRIAWHQPGGAKLRHKLARVLDSTQTWFLAPVISTKVPLDRLGYISGDCPVAERIAPRMINIPTTMPDKMLHQILDEAANAGKAEHENE